MTAIAATAPIPASVVHQAARLYRSLGWCSWEVSGVKGMPDRAGAIALPHIGSSRARSVPRSARPALSERLWPRTLHASGNPALTEAAAEN